MEIHMTKFMEPESALLATRLVIGLFGAVLLISAILME